MSFFCSGLLDDFSINMSGHYRIFKPLMHPLYIARNKKGAPQGAFLWSDVFI